MNMNWTRFGDCNRNGLTLIEVIAGLLLMSTLLVGILTAGSQHMRQLRQAKLRLAAADVAEQALIGWAQSGNKLTAGQCAAPNADGLAWRVRPIGKPDAPESLGIEIVRLEVFDIKADEAKSPLISVDIVSKIHNQLHQCHDSLNAAP